jgi:hypothetical protein
MDPVETLRDRATARGWTPTDDPRVWTTHNADGSEEAVVRVAGSSYDARVLRHPTGPTPGPDPELSNGPQVFRSVDEALDYAESNLGAEGR